MLPKKNRISKKDFPLHTQKGFRVFSPFFTAVFYKTTKKESSVAVVVSKKTAKTAVVRNRLRRRLYEAVKPTLCVLTTPVTLVVYPKIEAQKTEFSVLVSEVEKIIEQAKVK